MLSYRTGCPWCNFTIKLLQMTVHLAFYSCVDPYELPIQQACFPITAYVMSVLWVALT